VHRRSVTQVHVIVKRPIQRLKVSDLKPLTQPFHKMTYAFLDGGESKKVIVP
jgi:hypothetical protein